MMMRRVPRSTMNDAGVLSLSVNQDATCIAVGSLHGIRIFNIEQGRTLFSEDYGAVKYETHFLSKGHLADTESSRCFTVRVFWPTWVQVRYHREGTLMM